MKSLCRAVTPLYFAYRKAWQSTALYSPPHSIKLAAPGRVYIRFPQPARQAASLVARHFRLRAAILARYLLAKAQPLVWWLSRCCRFRNGRNINYANTNRPNSIWTNARQCRCTRNHERRPFFMYYHHISQPF